MTLPNDPADAKLRELTHPIDWVNPTPADRYHLVVIGGGPAGLVAALGAAGLGARVALIERDLLGGDCLVHGCVPSKAVLRVANAAASVKGAERFGIDARIEAIDFGAAMARMRAIRAGIAPHDSASRLAEAGIDVFFGAARFAGDDAVRVGEHVLRFRRCCIATGARASRPAIPGLEDVDVLTNATLFELEQLPPRLTIVGAGVIGCEMAQAFARLGSEVTVVDQSTGVLSREDADAASVVAASLRRDGVTLCLGVGVERFERTDDARITVLGDGRRVAADAILLAVGRTPNVELDLEAVGVRYDPRGVQVDDRLRTSNPRIFAAGDVIGRAQLTHAADHHARIVIQNALFPGRRRVSELVIPRAVYTEPELAAVGVTGDEARSRGMKDWTIDVADTDRGRTDGEESGFARIWADSSGRIHGATIVCAHAGELIAPVTLAMTHGLKLGDLGSTVFAYPTRSELLFKAASAYNRTRLTPLAQRVLGWWFAIT